MCRLSSVPYCRLVSLFNITSECIGKIITCSIRVHNQLTTIHREVHKLLTEKFTSY
jgi:hypothetical protein